MSLKKTNITKKNFTRKNNEVKKLAKTSRSRILGMESYKVNCGKNLLIGYKSIKSAEETSMNKNDFVHVLVSSLKDYEKPVVVKVYDINNRHLPIENRILEKIKDYRNTAKIICDFSCNDDKNRYFNKIKKQIKFCSNGTDMLHFFIYEYIPYGDISDYLNVEPEYNKIKSLILQLGCVIIELATIYRVYHGDLNAGNVMVDLYDKDIIEYFIEGETVEIKSYGIMPKLIDYGRSSFYQNNIIPPQNIWFDIIVVLGILYNYIKNTELKQKLFILTDEIDMYMPNMKSYYNYLQNSL